MNSEFKLKKHQEPPVKFMKNNYGLILYHSTGSGKTITSLVAMNQFDDQVVVIGRKQSSKAFKDDMKKIGLNKATVRIKNNGFNDNIPKFEFYTFNKIKKLLAEDLDILANKSVIIDEAHNLRNPTVNNLTLITALSMCKRVMLLTATPVINYMNDLSVLINIVKNSQVLPVEIDSFNSAYYNSYENKIESPDVLIRKLSKCISYYDKSTGSKDYPTNSIEYIGVEMIHEQLMEYKNYIRTYIFDTELDYRGTGKGEYMIEFDDLTSRKKNFFLRATSHLSNTINGSHEYHKPKAMYEKIMKERTFPMVVYSNYLENGIYSVTKILERTVITYATITGKISNEKINFIVNDYNKRRIDVLFITSAGSESLDLKGTQAIYIMEPHWNESRINQVIGRAIRYKSHSELPENKRHVKIVRWYSRFPSTIANQSADEYLMELSKRKERMFNAYNQIIQDASIENNDIKKYDNYKKQKGAIARSNVKTKHIYASKLPQIIVKKSKTVDITDIEIDNDIDNNDSNVNDDTSMSESSNSSDISISENIEHNDSSTIDLDDDSENITFTYEPYKYLYMYNKDAYIGLKFRLLWS
jgi:superfamily II DNA or RNA helicase